MKTAFLISGFDMHSTAADDEHATLRAAIGDKGYNVVPVPFTWKYTTVSEYVLKFVDFYNRNKSEYNILIGNSYGAMVSFLAATIVKPNRILLCSLSPYFSEDVSKTTIEYRLKRFGKRREQAMNGLSAKATADKINKTDTDVTLLYGKQEKKVYGSLVQRVKETANDLKRARLVEVANAPHQFIDPAYIQAIAKEL